MFRYLLYPFAVFHLLAFYRTKQDVRELILSDVDEMNRRYKLSKGLLYYLVLWPAYRNLFYYRIGGADS